MRAGLRALVWIVAILSLAMTARFGVLYALSEPPPEGFDALDLPRPENPRLVVVPAIDPEQANEGDVVLYQTANGTRVARVLFVATRNVSGGYDVPALNATNATSVTLGNHTWDLPATLGNGTGLYVADDRNATPHSAGAPLVDREHLVGVVARVEDGRALLMWLGLTIVGAIVPIAVLVMSQRPRRAPAGATVWDPKLAPPAPTTPCIDCGRPVAPTATFCTACGAYLRREGPPR